MAVLAVVSAIGLLVDDRTLLGSPVWLKPLKFSVSFAAYGLSLAWLLSLIPGRRRTVGAASAALVATATTEMVIIVFQTARGRRSHFNTETPFDATLFEVMGGTIALFWGATLLVAVLLARVPFPDRAAALALRAGLLIALAGMAVGVLMTLPQQAAPALEASGAHAVGVPDGGPGMPLTGWSTTGGDLRIPHFVGMHALQALPLLLLALDTVATRLPRSSDHPARSARLARLARLRDPLVRLRLVRAAALATGGLTALLTWQALRGQPLLRPDALTLTALAVLLALTAAVAAHALRSPSGGTP
ncbi:hypothetical protein ACWGJ2_07390 [Streptomyces sp. NPDC054796]